MKKEFTIDLDKLAEKVAYVERMMKSIDGKKKADVTEEELEFLNTADAAYEDPYEYVLYVDYYFFTTDELEVLMAFELLEENEFVCVTCRVRKDDIVHIPDDWDEYLDCEYHAGKIIEADDYALYRRWYENDDDDDDEEDEDDV